MEIRFHIDPDLNEPHIWAHGIMEEEVRQVMRRPGQDLPSTKKSRTRIGQTAAGRYLKVIYVPDDDGEGIFVVTAYELRGRAKTAFRRRQRRKRQ